MCLYFLERRRAQHKTVRYPVGVIVKTPGCSNQERPVLLATGQAFAKNHLKPVFSEEQNIVDVNF